MYEKNSTSLKYHTYTTLWKWNDLSEQNGWLPLIPVPTFLSNIKGRGHHE